MQSKAWEAMIRKIPARNHEGMVFVTTSGIEIVVQSLIQAQGDYVIFRGRTAGTNDTGRIIVLPYEQLHFMTFKRAFTEAEVLTIFGETEPEFVIAGSGVQPLEESAPLDEPHQEALLTPESMGMPKPGKNGLQPGQPSKSMLLAKLRARLNNDKPNLGPK